MNPVIGIDLGTTNTVVGVVQDGHAAAVADESGARLIPSVVSFHPNGSVLVGAQAKERRLVDAANTVYSIKRLIGRSWDSEEVRKARERFPFEMREGPGQAALVVTRGQSYTLPEISAFVLRRAKAIADTALGSSIEKAVITVPANFNDLQRAATKVAGRVAGIEVLRILNEPTAAALAYGFGKGTSERIAVYDFGGGTFDVTLLDLSENVFEVLATAGNTFLGGDDIDLTLAERMAHEFLRQHKYDARGDGQAFERLRMAAEELKIRLSRENEATVNIPEVAHGTGGKALGLSFSMTRQEFDQLIAPIVERTFDVCREALGIARLSHGDFDQILLVGGSTRIPQVRERVEDFFHRPVLGHISPDEVVAIGAAIQAAALTGVERRREIPSPPQPASRHGAPPMARKGGTLPPGASPPASVDPSTEPYQRRRVQTAPGVQADSQARKLPLGPGQRVVVASQDPTSAVPGTEPPRTVAGLGARGRVPTGTGLGPEAAAARARAEAEAPRLTTPGVGDPSQIVPPKREPIRIPGVDDPTAEAGHIASFLARYASTPQKPRVTQPGPSRPPPMPAKPKEESVSYRLSEDDISYEDPSALQPPTDMPTTEALRRMAGPTSTDEVTEVHRRRSQFSIEEEQRLPIPSVPDEEDMTMDTATSPAARAPVGLGGTLEMPARPPPPPLRPQPPSSLATPTSPRPDLQPPPAAAAPLGPFGNVGTLVSSSLDERTAERTAPGNTAAMQVPGSPNLFGGLPEPAPAPPAAPAPQPNWGSFGAAAAVGVGAMAAAPAPVIQQMAPPPGAPLLVDVTPLTLVVETVQGYCDAIIARNTPVPCERSRTFATAADGQSTVRVRVGQGESKAFGENTLLGEVELSGLRPAPRGQVNIEVSFTLDTDGILNVKATDVATGQEARATVRLVAMPDAQQVAAMAARQAGMPVTS